ncbi:MAG TPA: hypothetical protein VH165_03530 [Kofleriaceae bacterium]|jgi:hypothetical protein|nr:hypothetical protein [Kofleriaceae bacterium]
MRIVAIAAVTAAVMAGVAGALAGCGSSASPPDAIGPCWPDTVGPAKGTATLGTGRAAFEDMPDMLPLEYGAQAGFDLVANVRMSGLDPGDPASIISPTNPRTRIRAFFADTNIPLNYDANCPFREAYVPSATGDYQMAMGVAIVFEICWRSDRLIGQRIRVDLELEDDTNGYTSDSKTVTAAAPSSPYPIDQDSPGCMH